LQSHYSHKPNGNDFLGCYPKGIYLMEESYEEFIAWHHCH